MTRGISRDVRKQLVVVLLARHGSHRDCGVNGIRRLGRVPGVDDEGAVEGVSGAGELGEDEDSMSLLLAGDVLVRDLKSSASVGRLAWGSLGTHQVHPIASRGDEASVADGVERAQLVERDAAVHKVNRHELDRPEATIDPPDKLVDRGAKVLVLLDVLARGNGDLDEDHLADPFRVLVEEDFKSVEFLRDALDVVEAVDADDDLDSFEATPKSGDTLNDAVLLEALRAFRQV